MPGGVLDEPDSDEDESQHGGHREALHRQPPRPLDGCQELEQQRERHVEEGDVLHGLLEVGGVERLQRVQHDEREQGQLDPSRGPLPPRRSSPVGQRRRGRA